MFNLLFLSSQYLHLQHLKFIIISQKNKEKQEHPTLKNDVVVTTIQV